MWWAVMVCVTLGVAVCGAVQVQQDVENIFKTVEKYMSGGLMETSQEASPRRYRVRGPASQDVGDLPVSQRATREDFIKPLPAFPVGVILSDNLYPLVVGKNVETGKPFVMDLSSQHALVVARAGGQNYKMVIPFPVMLGAPDTSPSYKEDDTPPPPALEYRSRGTVPPRGYPTKLLSYKQNSSNKPRYPPNKNYNEGSLQEPSSPEEKHTINSQKVPKKYFYHYLDNSARVDVPLNRPGGPHYLSNSPLVPNRNIKHPKYRKYYSGEDGRPRSVDSSSGRDSYSQKLHPVSFPKEHITYYVEGPKYVSQAPKKYVSQEDGSPGADYHDKLEQLSAAPTVAVEAKCQVYHDRFRPSPYLGNITHDYGEPVTEVYESYDDRATDFTEQDYLDSIRDKPESHSSTGEVRHVTYHADDYLGKIYEEMYYRMPEPRRPVSSSSGHLNTHHSQGQSYQSSKFDRETDVEPEAANAHNHQVNVTVETVVTTPETDYSTASPYN